MTFFYILMLLVSLVLAAAFTFRRAIEKDVVSLLLKTAASTAFILLGFVSFRASSGAVSIAILPGLVMGLIGDIYLDLKYVFPEHETTFTYTGFGAFILGHFCYMIFLFSQYPLTVAGLIIALIIGISAGIGIYITPELMKVNYGRFHLISSVYGALLVFITVYSLCLCFAGFTGAKIVFFFGILLFLMSDLVLSQVYFGQDQDTPKNSMINHGAYYLGQIMIAASIIML